MYTHSNYSKFTLRYSSYTLIAETKLIFFKISNTSFWFKKGTVFRKNRYNWIFWPISSRHGDDLHRLNVVTKYHNRYKNISNMRSEFKISLTCIAERHIVQVFICKSAGPNLERALSPSSYLWWSQNHVTINKPGLGSCMHAEWLYILGSRRACHTI